jgi:hypothetical protein
LKPKEGAKRNANLLHAAGIDLDVPTGLLAGPPNGLAAKHLQQSRREDPSGSAAASSPLNTRDHDLALLIDGRPPVVSRTQS